MKPILYDKTETAFTSAGLAILSDCISCTVEEELNGTYECVFEYPIDGRHYDMIQEGLFIGATHDDSGTIQPFEIYKRSAPLGGIVEFNAHHISYKLGKTVVLPFNASSLSEALTNLAANIVGDTPFSFSTDMTATGDYSLKEPEQVRSALGGGDKSIIGIYKGELEFDKFDVIVHERRGSDTDVEIRYGKNLTDMLQEIDTSDQYNAIVPYWKSNVENAPVFTLPEVYIAHDPDAELTTIPINLTDKFENQPTYAQLREEAHKVQDSAKGWLPKESITVDFVALWQTKEYENYAELQRVHLGDGVSVYYPALGVVASGQRVVRTLYNTLLDRFDEITLNQLGDTLASLTDQKVTADITSAIEEARSTMMSPLMGGAGGYIAITFNTNNQPQKLYVLDSPSLESAEKVLRFDENGMMRSSTGINGTFSSLITMSGTIAGVNLTKKTGTVTLNTSGVGTITSLVTSGQVPVFGYIDGEEAYVTFARTASGGFKIKCVDATGTPITGSKSITIYGKK